MPTSTTQSASTQSGSISPNYRELMKFLVMPFLESPDSLRIDCEISRTSRVLIRIAFEGEDKGRVFGRGGRNIQAIRAVLQGIAQVAGHSVHLDVFGDPPGGRDGQHGQYGQHGQHGQHEDRPSSARPQPQRSAKPRFPKRTNQAE